MKHMTLRQARILSAPGQTTHVHAARQLERMGAVEIVSESLVRPRRYYGLTKTVTVRLTEYGREMRQMCKLWRGRAG